MALIAPVENGELVQSSTKKDTSTKSKDGMDKDSFLQLLVAQMKYQDPLEPTSNTEYISQYAQFSQVEQIQNMATGMDLQRASSLVGQEVYVKTTDSKGDTVYKQGKVDYVVYQNNKPFLSIEEKLYPLEDLDTVADSDYLAAYNKGLKFVENINKLPNIGGIDMTDAADIDALEKEYNEMTDYEKTFLASDVVKILNKYTEKIKELRQSIESQEAEDKAKKFTGELGKLPSLDEFDLTFAEKVDALEKEYSEMSDFEKTFLKEEEVNTLNGYIDKLKELRENGKNPGGDDQTKTE